LTTAASAGAALQEGNPAPPIKVIKWLKGSPVNSFEKGKLYVVEFWATWCGPCRQSIPHLTELAKKYQGKVTVVGVNAFENPQAKDASYVADVAKFVTDMGDKMNYNVAVDGPEGTMASTWMRAANQNGIPTAFVVDRQSRIAWIGHPMMGLDEVLGQEVADKYDVAAAAKKRAAEADQQNALQTAMSSLGQLMAQGKNTEALAQLDKLITAYPAMKVSFLGIKYHILTTTDPAAALKLARSLSANEAKDNPMLLNELAWQMVDPAGKFPNADYDLALSMAKRAADLTKQGDAAIMDTLACAYFKKGDTASAIATEKKALALADQGQYPDEVKKSMKSNLDLFNGVTHA